MRHNSLLGIFFPHSKQPGLQVFFIMNPVIKNRIRKNKKKTVVIPRVLRFIKISLSLFPQGGAFSSKACILSGPVTKNTN